MSLFDAYVLSLVLGCLAYIVYVVKVQFPNFLKRPVHAQIKPSVKRNKPKKTENLFIKAVPEWKEGLKQK